MQKPTRAELVKQVEKHMAQRGYIDHSLRDCYETGVAAANEVAAAFDRLQEIIESGQGFETGIHTLASKLEKALPIIAVTYEKHSRFYKTVEDMAKDLRQITKNNSLEMRDYFPDQKGRRSEFLAQRIAARREFEATQAAFEADKIAYRRKFDRPTLGTSSNSDTLATHTYLAYSALEDDTHFTERTSNMDMSSSFDNSSASCRHSDNHSSSCDSSSYSSSSDSSSSSYDSSSSSSSSFDSGSFGGF